MGSEDKKSYQGPRVSMRIRKHLYQKKLWTRRSSGSAGVVWWNLIMKRRRPAPPEAARRRAFPEASRRACNGGVLLERKVRALRELLPNASSVGLDGLFNDTAEYVMCLELQVRVMQIMVQVFANSK